MTMLTIDTRIGKLALIAAAVAVALIAFGAPAVTEAAGGTGAGASADVYWPGFFGIFGVFIDWLSGWNLCC